jgi:hypothetical protein
MSGTGVVLPYASTDLEGDPELHFDGGSLKVYMKFWTPDGFEKHVLCFDGARAHMHLAEPFCEAWHYEIAYDRVAVVENSSWSAAIEGRAPVPSPTGKHFVLAIDSWGCLEVLAFDVALVMLA